jgi:hypothetical protein
VLFIAATVAWNGGEGVRYGGCATRREEGGPARVTRAASGRDAWVTPSSVRQGIEMGG